MGSRRPRRVDEGVTASWRRRLGGDASPYLAILGALGLHALGFVAQQTRISILAFLLFTWGVLRLGGGKRWGDAAMFPLGFMVFAIPVNVLDTLGFWLRMWVVETANGVAQLGGIEVVRSGTQLFAPDRSYQYDVAAACSGVRSLVALAALSLLIGYLNFRTVWRRALVFALCFPLTYIGNVVRVLAIIFAAELGGQLWGERMHAVMGFGVFVIVLGGVMLGARLIQRWLPEPGTLERSALEEEGRNGSPGYAEAMAGGPHGSPSENDETCVPGRLGEASLPVVGRRSGANLRALVLPGAIVLLVVVEMAFLAKVAAAPTRGAAGVRLSDDGRNPVELPAFVGTEWIGRRAEVTAVERDVLPADTGFSRRTYVHVQGGVHAVLFSIVLSGRDRSSIHRPEVCLVGQGWTIRHPTTVQLRWGAGPGTTLPATLLRTERVEPKSGRRLPALTAYWFVNRDIAVASHGARFWHDAWNRLRHARADRWAYVLMQADAADGEAAALERMQAVLHEVWPVVRVKDGAEH